MNGKFITGMVAGSVIGVSAGVYAFNKTTPRKRRRMMRKGMKMARNATKMAGTMANSLDFM